MGNVIGKMQRFTKVWLLSRQGSLEKMQKHLQAEIELLKTKGDMSEEGLKVLQPRLDRVEEALENIRLGTYGTCPTCHRPIPEKRLEVLPSTIHCSFCQRKMDASRSPHPLRSFPVTVGTLKCQIKLPSGGEQGD
jgi:RNA polymerase-binding transcription factor DksA